MSCSITESPASAEAADISRNSTPSLSARPGNIPRFYAQRNTSNQNDENVPSTRPPQQPSTQQPDQHHPTPTPTLEETRQNALRTLATCRTIIATLEVIRIYKSRLGSGYWLVFWERLYEPTLARALGARITQTMGKINTLFRSASLDLHQLTQRMENAIQNAESEQEILMFLEHLENEVGVRRRRRRRRAAAILDKMRAVIEEIPVKVGEELFDEMKRGVFALDVFCDYHPGDPVAEARDRMGSVRFVDQPEGVVISSDAYQRWLADANAAGSGGGGHTPSRVPSSRRYADDGRALDGRAVAAPTGGWDSIPGMSGGVPVASGALGAR